MPGDVTWALGYDSTAWVYTGGWGGGHFKVVNLTIFIIQYSKNQFEVFTIDTNKYLYNVTFIREIRQKWEFIQWKMQDTFMSTRINDGIH